MKQVNIRKFPYPYQAMFSLANDIDNTSSLQIFLEMMKLLNTSADTKLGKGFGLEIGSSFWFYNATPSSQLSYFKCISNTETSFAPYCRQLWQSGHIDSLHTYGNFDESGFERKYAELSLNVLQKYQIQIPTWVNHGNENNSQNLGLYNFQYGAIPDRITYHFDLAKSYGIRYVWSGKMTHVLGQNSKSTLNVRFKKILQILLAYTKYRQLSLKPFDLKNSLLDEIKLQDGNSVWDFQRFINNWGREQILDINDLTQQIKPININRLISNQGFLVIYTHMCEGLNSLTQFPGELYTALNHISQKFQQKKLLVATTSRLLQYSEIINNLEYNSYTENNFDIINIESYIKTLGEKFKITESFLQGVTFYCQHPGKTKVIFQKKELEIVQNPKDQTGIPSVSIPWKQLEYPI